MATHECWRSALLAPTTVLEKGGRPGPPRRCRCGQARVRGAINPRMCVAGQTGVETAIATARPFLGVRASSLGLQKALDALYNFPAGCQAVGCKPGPQSSDEVGNLTKPV